MSLKESNFYASNLHVSRPAYACFLVQWNPTYTPAENRDIAVIELIFNCARSIRQDRPCPLASARIMRAVRAETQLHSAKRDALPFLSPRGKLK